jgi:hypothetical protein
VEPVRTVHAVLILIACAATLYASAAFLARMDTDFTAAAVIAALCLFAAVCVDWVERRGTYNESDSEL